MLDWGSLEFKVSSFFVFRITTMAAINNFEESGQDDDLPASISCQETPRKQSLRSLIYCNRHSLGTPAVLPGKSKVSIIAM